MKVTNMSKDILDVKKLKVAKRGCSFFCNFALCLKPEIKKKMFKNFTD